MFWGWFDSEVRPLLAKRSVPSDSMITELDERVTALSLSWELGPANDGSGGWAFAISFGADLGRLASAQAMVDSAPKLNGVQVVLGKPQKIWDGVLELPTARGTVIFDTSRWTCLVLSVAGGVAISVVPIGVEEVDEDLVAYAAAIAVQSELGELRYAQWVRDLSVLPYETTGAPGIRCKMKELRSLAG
ncbi:MAG: hypothetical protein ABMB14_15225 [Myxococcota bacterium]